MKSVELLRGPAKTARKSQECKIVERDNDSSAFAEELTRLRALSCRGQMNMLSRHSRQSLFSYSTLSADVS